MRNFFLFLAGLLFLAGCAGNPVNAVAVSDFNSEKYLGTWYEVARLDHSFERGLTDVTANYTRRADGGITVLNRGFDTDKGKFDDAKGKAKFAGDETTGHLKVSFFGPFYGDYIIFGLDKPDYSYAFVSGGKDNYLWLLSRTPNVLDAVREAFIAQSQSLGYDTDTLIWVDQSRAASAE